MIIAGLIFLGLCLGSFINALVWRLHEQLKFNNQKQSNGKPALHNEVNSLSIVNGRSMCPNCKHSLSPLDLLPVISWILLNGKCRYCNKSISIQYPIVELGTVVLFLSIYIWWPVNFSKIQILLFIIWLLISVTMIALAVYDLRWKILPNKLIYALGSLAVIQAIIYVLIDPNHQTTIINFLLSVLVGGGIFYILYQVSKGSWIGGGDVKLGWALGLLVGTPGRSLLFIFLAALAGSLISLPLLLTHRLNKSSTIPFGPLLIMGAIIVQLFGHSILLWYQNTFFTFSM